MSGSGCRDGRSRKMLRTIGLLLCAFLLARSVSAADTPITPTSPEGISITDAAQILDDFGAKQAAQEIRAKLAAGGYSYGDVNGNAETDFATSNARSTTKISTGFVHPSNPSERPIKNFGLKLRLVFLLFHENVHANQGYFNYRKNSFEPPAWMATINMAETWVTYAVGGVPTNAWPGNDPTGVPRVLSPKETLTLIRELRDYIREFREGEGHDPYYGLDPTSADVTNLNAWETRLSSLQQTYQAIVDGTAPPAAAAANSPVPGNAGTTGFSPGTTQPGAPAVPPTPSSNTTPSSGAATTPPATPATGGLAATSLPVGPQDCQLYRKMAADTRADAEYWKQQVAQDEVRLRNANTAQDKQSLQDELQKDQERVRDREQKAAEWERKLAACPEQYRTAQNPTQPGSTTGGTPGPANPPENKRGQAPGGQNPPGGNAVGGGAFKPVAGQGQQPCTSKAECDRLRAVADQAEKDAAAAKAAVTQAEADQKKAIEDAYRMDTEATNQAIRPSDVEMSTAEKLAAASAKHKQAQTLRDNAAAALKRAQDDAVAKSKAAADARAAADACKPCPEENKTAQKTGTDTTPSAPPDKGTGTTGGTPQTDSQVGGAQGAKTDEFAGGKQKRQNFGKFGYGITKTTKNGKITEETLYNADGTFVSSRREEETGSSSWDTKTTYTAADGSYTVEETSNSFLGGSYHSKTSEYDKNGKLLKRTTFTNTFKEDTGFTEVTETFGDDGRITTTTRKWTGKKLRGDKPDSETTSKTSTPGLDQLGKGLQEAVNEGEKKAESDNKGFVPNSPKDEEQPKVPTGEIGRVPGSDTPDSVSIGSVAFGDVTGNGKSDIITGAAPGDSPHVRVFDGTTGQLLSSFYAYDPTFTGGVNVAVGDVNGDGTADIITGAGPGGGPQVKVFDGKTGLQLNGFYAYDPSFTGGVNVAVGDVNGDGKAEIVTGAGPGGGPQVKVFSGNGLPLTSFFAYDQSYTGGVNVGVGDLTGNGGMGIVTGTTSLTRPEFRGFDFNGQNLTLGKDTWNRSTFLFGKFESNNMQVDKIYGWSRVPREDAERFLSLPGISGGATAWTYDPGIPVWTQTQSNTLYSALDSASQRTLADFTGPGQSDLPSGPNQTLQRKSGAASAESRRGARVQDDSRTARYLQLAAFHPQAAGNAAQQAPAGTQSSSSQRPSAGANQGEIEFAIVSNGKTGDEALQFQVFDAAGEVKKIPPLGGVVLEPIKQSNDEKTVAERHAGAAGLLTQQISAYCLDFIKLPPEAGTLYRIAPQSVQEKFKPLRSILQAGHSLADKGLLHPDSDPKDYVAFVRQYALWTKIENWDAKKFTDTFLEQAKKNADVMNVTWSKQMEDALRGLAPGRWTDITAVLGEAEKISKEGSNKPAD